MPAATSPSEPRRACTASAKRGPRLGRRGRIVAGVLAVVGLVVVGAVVAARTTFQRQVSREVDALFAAAIEAPPSVIAEAELAGLPEPVRRWLQYSKVAGMERPVTIRLKQEGDFQMREGWPWVPLTAEQYITTDPPGFVWSASIRVLPGLSIIGRDRYAGGTGSMQMRLLALVPVVDKSGGGLDQGAMLRYLGEIGWYPAAALSPFITWEPIDATTARATMTYAGTTASATFIFDAEGRQVEVQAERFNDTTGRLERWSGRTLAYGEIDGMPVITEAESVWHYDDGDFTPFRLRITQIEYNRPTRW